MATTDTDDVRIALRGIVDRLLDEKPVVTARFRDAFEGSEHAKDWIVHALGEHADQLVPAHAEPAPAEPVDADKELRAAAEKLVTHVLTQAPVLALVPADVLAGWLLDEVG